jgi:signal transduction histidine kinase
MFEHTREAMAARASLLTTHLAGLDNLTTESVTRVMAAMGDQTQYRTVVVDRSGLVVYDNLTSGAVVGRYALAGEIADALSGSDVFRSSYRDAAFDSRFAMPVIARREVIGALYLGRHDAAQGRLLAGLQSNLIAASVLIFAVVVLFSAFIALVLTRRISVILHGIRAAYGGNYAYELPVRGRDELTEVAERLNQLFSLLHKTETSRQRFVSDASHELKTPLAAVRLLTDSILETPEMPAETVREFVSDIGRETERLSRMTEKLMTLSRLDTHIAGPTAMTDPAAVTLRVSRMLEPLAKSAGIELRCELAEDCRILGGEDDLIQIVYNLIDNAVKYNKPGGEVRVFVYIIGAEAHLIVADTGSGIPEEELPFVFDRFYRVDKARSRTEGGEGLGLSIVAETVKRLGGSITAESELGKGSRFTVKFPLVQGVQM